MRFAWNLRNIMKSRRLTRGPHRALVALALAVLCVTAVPAGAASQIATSTTSGVFNSGSKFYTHCSNGYYWVSFRNGTSVVLFSSNDGVTWTSQGAIFSFNPGVNNWAVRYLGNVVIAFGFNGGDSVRYYRKATLNGDGTLSWNAAEAPVGVADGTWTELNALIANGKPVLWRAGPTNSDAGRFTIGDQLDSPVVWADTPNAPSLGPAALPGNGTNGGFSAGAIFPAGGSDPDDLIVLRATTASAPALGSHRLVAVKYDASLNAFDTEWYSVSTLGGSLAEDISTEVLVYATDEEAHRRFTVVTDSSGNIHVVYVNRLDRVVHYKKDPGFNDSWTRLGTDVTGVSGGKVALTAAASDNLFLFFESDATPNVLQSQRFDGATWGSASTLFTGTDLQKSLGAMERFGSCSPAVAFNEGIGSPFNVMFSLDTASCAALQPSEGAGTITVTAPGSFEMTFDTSQGGGMSLFYDLVDDPSRTYDLAGGVSGVGTRAFYHFSFEEAGNWYQSSSNTDGPKLDLLEATPTRVKVRQEAFFQQPGTSSILAGVKGFGDYSIYPVGRMALRWNRKTTATVNYNQQVIEAVVHSEGSPPLSTWSAYRESGGPWGAPGDDDFFLIQIQQPGQATTDFLGIFYKDWQLPDYPSSADLINWGTIPPERLLSYYDITPGSLGANTEETWDILTYFKPTNFLDNTDPEVTGRSADYRGPDSLSVTTGGPWIDASENTGGGDDFNESESAYVLTFDPALGLVFDIDGGGTTRHSPFFKIRQWRSLQDPPGVTLEGTPLANDVDYRADVKPVSRAHFAQDLLWHSTLQNLGALDTAPDVGTPGATSGTVNFVAARYGNGAQVVGTSAYFNFPTAGNLDTAKGAIEFWYRPDYDSTDGSSYTLGGYNFNGANFWLFEKDNFNNLSFGIRALAQLSEIVAGPASYSWRANDWVHLRFEWDDTLPVATQLKIFVNGVEPNPGGGTGADYVAATNVSTNFQVGRRSPGGGSPGIYDEVRVYGGAGATPSPLAHGGLTASADEFLADTAKDFTFTFVAVNGTGQGEYLYLGADSSFRGLNVALDTLGSGTVDLQWDYWNGTSWSDLELVGGFTDETNDLTKHGTIYWQDPGGWSPYSINGGPDLFYVRASLASGSYTQAPIENVIKTDILLFQYCGDITMAAQTFDFAVPTPTAVELVSFEARGVDGAVELSWETASELNNLGFHVYRATTSEGAYERVTARAIPGLGSSPVGARYSYRDAGLTNGVTFYYKLEDIETTGRTEFHGPVSATPGSGGESSSSTSSSSQSSTTSLITYGDPSANSLRVLKRGSRQLVLELVTEGFYAEPQEDGSVRLEVPGFESLTEVAGPGMPVKRTWVDAVAGRKVKLLSVRARGVEAFTSLRPSDAELPDIVATPAGTVRLRQGYGGQVRAARRRARKAFREDGLSPSSAARIVSVGFQGDVKKALVELAPLRWDESRGQLLLARRLVVRLSFRGREPSEVSTDDARGRRYARKRSHDQRNVVAHLRTTERGLHSVRYEDVMRGRRGVRASTLRLSRQGETVAFHLQPNGNRFKSGSTLYFVSEGAQENAFGNEAVYELEVGAPGEAMAQSSAAPSGERQPVYWHRAEWEEDRYYQAALVEAPDLWLWDLLFAPETKSYPIEVSALAPGASKLSVWLQGVSDFPAEPDHHMRVYVNGSLVEELSWDGKKAKRLDVELATGLLREGDNLLELENVGDTEAAYSMVMLDRYALEYPRVALAGDGRLEGRWNAAGAAELSGLVAGTHVLDMSEAQPSWLVDTEVGADGLLRFRAEAGRSYLAVSPEAVYHPAVTNPEASRLKNTRNRADYLVIGPEAFLRAAIPLLELRQSEGLKVKAVSIEEVYSEFGFGEPTPEALKDFLSYAYHKWRQPSPRYVLLLGDATFDFKDHLQTGVTNQVPPRMVKTSYLWTASDPSYAAVNGDDLLPDLAIGRLPVATVEQVQAMVEKIVAYETGEAGLHRSAVVLVADNPDRAGNFEVDADELAATVLASKNPEKIYLSQLGTAATRNAIVQRFDEGASLMSYLGHGGIHLWADENFFNVSDVASLGLQSRQPLLLTMNCLNGYFHFPYFNSLAEELVQAKDKGAIAAFSPSGLSLNGPANVYHKALLQELFNGRHGRLGDAVLAAQERYAATGTFPELLTIYHLLGDPALTLK